VFQDAENQGVEKKLVELVHKWLYRVVILMSDLTGGMIKLSDVINVN
jgi:hypothetical protein